MNPRPWGNWSPYLPYCGSASERGQSDQSGDSTGDQERQHDHALRVDTGCLGGRRILTGDPQVEAEAAAVEHDVVADADGDGDRQESLEHDVGREVEADRLEQAVEVRDSCCLREWSGLGDHPGASIPMLAQQVEDQLAGDEVEHDRGDHLVDVAGDLEHGGDRRPDHRHEHGDEEDRRRRRGAPAAPTSRSRTRRRRRTELPSWCWPSTPMLNRRMMNPIATATPAT